MEAEGGSEIIHAESSLSSHPYGDKGPVVGGPQLVAGVLEMGVNGGWAQTQALADFLQGIALGPKLHHLHFPGRKLPGFRFFDSEERIVRGLESNSFVRKRLTSSDSPHGGKDGLGAVFMDDSLSPGIKSGLSVSAYVEGRHHEDLRGHVIPTDGFADSQPIDVGHGDIGEEKIRGMMASTGLDRQFSVIDGIQHMKMGKMLAQDACDDGQTESVVIHNKEGRLMVFFHFRPTSRLNS